MEDAQAGRRVPALRPALPHGLLRPEDRADFEAVQQLALSTPDIRRALRTDPTGRAAARLRIRTLADADAIAAAARDEYRAYLTLHTSARDDTPRHLAGRSVLPALAVLTPLVAGSSAAVLLLLGYLLQLVEGQGTLPGSLATAGWVLAFIAAMSALTALGALLVAATRRRGDPAHTARADQARQNWHKALMTHGILPHLRRCIDEDPSLTPQPTRRDPAGPNSVSA